MYLELFSPHLCLPGQSPQLFRQMPSAEMITSYVEALFPRKVQTVGPDTGHGGWKLSLNIPWTLQAEFDGRIHLNSQFPGTERLPNTCNFSIRGPLLRGEAWPLLVSVSSAHLCHGARQCSRCPCLGTVLLGPCAWVAPTQKLLGKERK